MRVLVDQAAPFVVDQVFGLDCLGHHGRNQSQAFQFGFIITIGFEPQIDAERAHRLAFYDDGNAHVRDLLLVQIALSGAIQEHRFTADFRYGYGLAGFDNTAGNSFAESITCKPAGVAQSCGYLDTDFLRLRVKHRHGSANDAVPVFQYLEYLFESDSSRQFATEDLSGLDQHRKLPGRVVAVAEQSLFRQIGSHFRIL